MPREHSELGTYDDRRDTGGRAPRSDDRTTQCGQAQHLSRARRDVATRMSLRALVLGRSSEK